MFGEKGGWRGNRRGKIWKSKHSGHSMRPVDCGLKTTLKTLLCLCPKTAFLTNTSSSSAKPPSLCASINVLTLLSTVRNSTRLSLWQELSFSEIRESWHLGFLSWMNTEQDKEQSGTVFKTKKTWLYCDFVGRHYQSWSAFPSSKPWQPPVQTEQPKGGGRQLALLQTQKCSKISTEFEAPILWPSDVKSASREKTLTLEKIEGRRRRGQQRMRFCIVLPTQWTWVLTNFTRQWRTGKPGALQPIGSQRAGHNWSDLACMHAQWLNNNKTALKSFFILKKP